MPRPLHPTVDGKMCDIIPQSFSSSTTTLAHVPERPRMDSLGKAHACDVAQLVEMISCDAQAAASELEISQKSVAFVAESVAHAVRDEWPAEPVIDPLGETLSCDLETLDAKSVPGTVAFDAETTSCDPEACQDSGALVAEALAAAHAVFNETCQAIVPCGLPEFSAPAPLQMDMDALRAICRQQDQMEHHEVLAHAVEGIPSVADLLELTDPHEVLGIEKDASKEAVRRAYYQRARIFHPDKHSGSSDVVVQAFNDAFMLITRSYMTLLGCVVQSATLKILNKIDLRKGRPPGGWAAQHKYDEKQRGPLAQAEAAVKKAEEDVKKAEAARPGISQERRLTMARLALQKATARVHAETELLALRRRKDEEKAEMQKKKEEGRAAREQRGEQERPRRPSKRHRSVREAPQPAEASIEEAARLEAQAEEMKRKAAQLRAQAQQRQDEAPAEVPSASSSAEAEALHPPAKRRALRISI